MDRNVNIQILRGIAIIAVVMIHTCPAGISQVLVRPFINFGVALFLFLSGYLTGCEIRNWIPFYTKRITRVIIPYIIWVVLYTLLNGSPSEIPKFLITSRAAGHLYFISVYIQLVLLHPVLIKLLNSRFRKLVWLIAPLSILFFQYLGNYGKVGILENHHVQLLWNISCFGWISYYYMGMIMRNKDLHIIKSSLKFVFFLLLLFLVIQIGEGFLLHYHGFRNSGSQLKLSCLISNMAMMLFVFYFIVDVKIKYEKQIFRILKQLGDYSFGIYLCHQAFIVFLIRSGINDYIPFCLNSFAVLCVSFVFCIIGRNVFGKRVSGWLGFQ